MPLLKKETYTQQASLAQYCRDGIVPGNLTGVKDENLHHYRRLVYNIIGDILETAYPITYSYLEREVWEQTIYDFFANYKCQTAQVWRLPLEFFGYCRDQKISEKLNLPFLNDLLYFEMLEMEVHTMEDVVYPEAENEGDWMTDAIALNPEYRLVKLEYPVHIHAPGEDLLSNKGDYFLLMYREKESGNVQFIDLSMFYTYVLENIMNGALLKDILTEANTLFQVNNIDLLKARSLEFIEDLRGREFVIGFIKK